MAFSVPTTVVTKNSGGSVTSTAGTFSQTIPVGSQIALGVTVASDTVSISSIVDTKGNTWVLEGKQTTTINRPIWIYSCDVTTQLLNTDTVTVTVSVSNIINFIGIALPGTIGTEPLQGTFSATTSTTAADILTSFQSNNEYVLSFECNGSSSPVWSSPAINLGLTSGGGGPFFTAAYTQASSGLAIIPGATWTPTASTWSMASIGTFAQYEDQYVDAYTTLYGQFFGTPWPALGTLAIVIEILVNGTWTDITSYCYQRDGSVNVKTSHGRPDESSKLVTANLEVQINNRSGVFSSKNPSSPFYPFLTRNTQIRLSCQADYNGPDAGFVYLFWGEVSEWPPTWDVTGTDIWMDLIASGITRRLNQQATIGSALKRYYLKKSPSDPLYPVALWPCEDGSNSTTIAEVTGNGSNATFTGSPNFASDTSFTGVDAIPVINGSTWTGATNSFSPPGDLTFSTPGSFSWQSPITGNVTVQAVGGGAGGGSAASGSSTPAGGGGAGEYASDTVAVTLNTFYPIVVGSGGAGGTPTGSNNGQNGNKSSFNAPAVVAHGGNYGGNNHAGTGGTGSTNATHHNGGNGFVSSTVAGGGGSSGGSTAAGNNATSATGAGIVDSYAGIGGDGGGSTSGGGGGGTGNFTKSYTATHSYAYAGSDGTYPNSKLSTDTAMQQGGDVANTFNGKSKTWILFNYGQIASDLAGATVTKVTLRLYSYHWWFNSGGTVAIGWDTTTSFPATKSDPSAHIDITEVNMTVGEVGTLNISTAIGTAFKSSSATSIVLFKNSNSLTYYGKFNGAAQSNPPVLTIYYSK